MKNKITLIGVAALALAVFIIVYNLGLIRFNIGFWTIIFTIFFFWILIKGLLSKSIFQVTLPLTILAMMYAKPLHIEALVPWPLIFVGILVTIGLSLIFRRRKRFYTDFVDFNSSTNKQINNEEEWDLDDSIVDMEVKFTSAIRYVRTNDFKHGSIKLTASEAKVYFDEAQIIEQADIIIRATASDLKLYVPKTWRVDNQISNIVSEISEKNNPSNVTNADLKLRGTVSASSVKIFYV